MEGPTARGEGRGTRETKRAAYTRFLILGLFNLSYFAVCGGVGVPLPNQFLLFGLYLVLTCKRAQSAVAGSGVLPSALSSPRLKASPSATLPIGGVTPFPALTRPH